MAEREEAEMDEEEARYQAMKDRDREPDRWPIGGRLGVGATPKDIAPLLLVLDAFVEYAAGKYVRAEKVRDVEELNGRAILNMASGEEVGVSLYCEVSALKIIAALNLALENGRQRRAERADY